MASKFFVTFRLPFRGCALIPRRTFSVGELMRDLGSLADCIWGKHADRFRSRLNLGLQDGSAFPAREQNEGLLSECVASIPFLYMHIYAVKFYTFDSSCEYIIRTVCVLAHDCLVMFCMLAAFRSTAASRLAAASPASLQEKFWPTLHNPFSCALLCPRLHICTGLHLPVRPGFRSLHLWIAFFAMVCLLSCCVLQSFKFLHLAFSQPSHCICLRPAG